MLEGFRVVDTDSIDELVDAFEQLYVRPTPQFLGRDRRLTASINSRWLQHVGVSYGVFNTSLGLDFPESDRISQILPISGRARGVINGNDIPMTPISSKIISPGVGTYVTLNGRYEHIILKINPQSLASKVAAYTGATVPSRFLAEPALDLTRAAVHAHRCLVQFLVEQLGVDRALSPLVAIELEQALMMSFLAIHRHNWSFLLERPSAAAVPWQVRRAEEYIEANWDRPITVEGLAEAINSSARSLFYSFRTTRGYSPMKFKKMVRLRQARKLLMRPDSQTSVTDIAIKCGFSNPGHFARAYFDSFGEKPSETLNTAKGMPAADGEKRH